jgi:glycine/D-amino acid oxidase-like deaminating enzyme
MADMPTQARVVIIGGGVVGVSALYHLARPAGPTAFCSKRTN